MGRVAFLPVELERAQEQAGAHFPAHNIAPLVNQNRQIAVRFNPLGIHRTDDGFRGGADNQRFFQLFTTAVGDDCQLWREAFDMLLLFLQEGHGDQQGEGSVDVPGSLKAPVKCLLDVFPQCPTVRTYHHAAAYGRIIGHFCPLNNLVIPLGEILALGWEFVVAHSVLWFNEK
jgi:hypothetical protein